MICWHQYRWSGGIVVTKDGFPIQAKVCRKCGKQKVKEAW